MSKDVLQEQEKEEIVISPDDVKNIGEFFDHFKIERFDYVEDVKSRFAAIAKDGRQVTLDDQRALRVAMAMVMCNSKHEMFKDELFKPILANCERLVYEETFKKEFETQIAVDPEQK